MKISQIYLILSFNFYSSEKVKLFSKILPWLKNILFSKQYF